MEMLIPVIIVKNDTSEAESALRVKAAEGYKDGYVSLSNTVDVFAAREFIVHIDDLRAALNATELRRK